MYPITKKKKMVRRADNRRAGAVGSDSNGDLVVCHLQRCLWQDC